MRHVPRVGGGDIAHRHTGCTGAFAPPIDRHRQIRQRSSTHRLVIPTAACLLLKSHSYTIIAHMNTTNRIVTPSTVRGHRATTVTARDEKPHNDARARRAHGRARGGIVRPPRTAARTEGLSQHRPRCRRFAHAGRRTNATRDTITSRRVWRPTTRGDAHAPHPIAARPVPSTSPGQHHEHEYTIRTSYRQSKQMLPSPTPARDERAMAPPRDTARGPFNVLSPSSHLDGMRSEQQLLHPPTPQAHIKSKSLPCAAALHITPPSSPRRARLP